MPEKEKIIIITNEKIFLGKGMCCCDNIDIKTIIEGLSKKFDVTTYCRPSINKRLVSFDVKKIFQVNNIFSFVKSVFAILKKKDKKILYISIHPFSFCFFIFVSLLRKNSYVYLRSDGFKEYNVILGKKWIWIYKIMFDIFTFSSKIISCHSSLAKGKQQQMINPSELDRDWLLDIKEIKTDVPKLLYVGRLKIEKGIFSLISIIKSISIKINLTIVGSGENILKEDLNFVKLTPYLNSKNKLINCYDESNIVILPSFTEAHPKVVDESLARLRPVIIFNEIKHIIQDRKGIFVADRNPGSLKDMIFYILNNYKTIQQSMKENKLPTKENFLRDLGKIIEN